MPPPKLSALEKLRQLTSAVRIQACIRQHQHFHYAVKIAFQTWEKLIDQKQNAYFYFNRTSGQTQWFKPLLLQKKLLEPNAEFNYYESDTYINQRYKVHQIPEVNPLEFQFEREIDLLAPEMDEEQYSIRQVDPIILQPPDEWTPIPKSKVDFGDTGLLTKTTGDSESWNCAKCKYKNRPGTLTCEICEAAPPEKQGTRAEDMLEETKLPTQTIPWSYPDSADNEDSSSSSSIAGVHEAQDLLRVLDKEHEDSESGSYSN